MHERFPLLLSAGALIVSVVGAPASAHAVPQIAKGIAAGPYHSCTVTSCGDVICWGRNDQGQATNHHHSLGPRSLFIQAPFTQVSVGDLHTCALDEDGEVVCWGDNRWGQGSPPAGPFTQIDAGAMHTCGVRRGTGAIACWGAGAGVTPSTDDAALTYVQVSAGHAHTCAVTVDRKQVRCWGNNSQKQAIDVKLENLSFQVSDFAEVSAGGVHTCARTQSRTIYCWGYDGYGAVSIGDDMLDSPNAPAGTRIVRRAGEYEAVSAGMWGTVAIDKNQKIVGWGWPYGVMPVFPVANNPEATHVSFGTDHGCYIDLLDRPRCWGAIAYNKSIAPTLAAACPVPDDPLGGYDPPVLDWP